MSKVDMQSKQNSVNMENTNIHGVIINFHHTLPHERCVCTKRISENYIYRYQVQISLFELPVHLSHYACT